jgi:hypothetical protein
MPWRMPRAVSINIMKKTSSPQPKKGAKSTHDASFKDPNIQGPSSSSRSVKISMERMGLPGISVPKSSPRPSLVPMR